METEIFRKPFSFMGKEYTNRKELAEAFTDNWCMAIAIFRAGRLENFYAEYMPQRNDEIDAIFHECYEETWRIEFDDEQVCFQKVFYYIDSSRGIPFVNGRTEIAATCYNATRLGEKLESMLPKKQGDSLLLPTEVRDAVEYGLISLYFPQVKSEEAAVASDRENVKAFEELAYKLQNRAKFCYQGKCYEKEFDWKWDMRYIFRKGHREVLQTLDSLYETDEYREEFKKWGDAIDSINGNSDYANLRTQWYELNDYMSNFELDYFGPNWKKRSLDELRGRIWVKWGYYIESMWDELEFYSDKRQVICWLDDNITELIEGLEISKENEAVIRNLLSMLDEAGRILAGMDVWDDETHERQEWEYVDEELQKRIEERKTGERIITVLQRILSVYSEDKLPECWKRADVDKKKCIVQVGMFPVERDGCFIEEICQLASLEKNAEISESVFWCLDKLLEDALAGEGEIGAKKHVINGQSADIYYLNLIEAYVRSNPEDKQYLDYWDATTDKLMEIMKAPLENRVKGVDDEYYKIWKMNEEYKVYSSLELNPDWTTKVWKDYRALSASRNVPICNLLEYNEKRLKEFEANLEEAELKNQKLLKTIQRKIDMLNEPPKEEEKRPKSFFERLFQK